MQIYKFIEKINYHMYNNKFCFAYGEKNPRFGSTHKKYVESFKERESQL